MHTKFSCSASCATSNQTRITGLWWILRADWLAAGVPFTANPLIIILIVLISLVPCTLLRVTVAWGNIIQLQQHHDDCFMFVYCCYCWAHPTTYGYCIVFYFWKKYCVVLYLSMLQAKNHDSNLRLWGCTWAPKWRKMHAIQRKQSGRCCVPFDLPFAFAARLTVFWPHFFHSIGNGNMQ